MRIILQFPEGLKQQATKEAATLEAQGHEVFIAAAPCYGACDLCLDEARNVKAEKIIHFGHAEFMKISAGNFQTSSRSSKKMRVKSDIEIEYRPYFSELDWKQTNKLLEKAVKMLAEQKAKSIALVFPVQHMENSKKVKKYLEEKELDVKLAMGGSHVRHAGQVLGCDSEAVVNADEVDAVLYFGGGKFHPTGIPSTKPVLCADPHLGDAYWITEEIKKAERKRAGSLLAAATKAKTFGILVSTKCGQINMTGARMAKKLLEKKGKKAAILVANELNPIALANFLSFDAYINTACPRINEDTEIYGKPIVNVADMKRLLELMV